MIDRHSSVAIAIARAPLMFLFAASRWSWFSSLYLRPVRCSHALTSFSDACRGSKVGAAFLNCLLCSAMRFWMSDMSSFCGTRMAAELLPPVPVLPPPLLPSFFFADPVLARRSCDGAPLPPLPPLPPMAPPDEAVAACDRRRFAPPPPPSLERVALSTGGRLSKALANGPPRFAALEDIGANEDEAEEEEDAALFSTTQRRLASGWAAFTPPLFFFAAAFCCLNSSSCSRRRRARSSFESCCDCDCGCGCGCGGGGGGAAAAAAAGG